MTLASSGIISTGSGYGTSRDISAELGRPGTNINFNQADVLALIGKSAGQQVILPNDFWGKSSSTSITYTYASNTGNNTLNVSTIAGYKSGTVNNITIIVNPGVYIYSTNTSTAALSIVGGTSQDRITLNNYGYIIGQGGNGAGWYDPNTPGVITASYNPTAGGPAVSISNNITIQGNGYIAGGGGGGGGAGYANSYGLYDIYCSGGGGAGGGSGGNYSNGAFQSSSLCGVCCYPAVAYTGGGGGGLGGAGGNGGGPNTGGGGGRILPGIGGTPSTQIGHGGGAGGGGSADGSIRCGVNYNPYSGAGGSAGNPGGSVNLPINNSVGIAAGSGGGGWGAAGGTSNNAGGVYNSALPGPGAAGGKAIQLNGYSISYSGVTIYGAVS